MYLFKFSKGIIFIFISILVLTIGFGYQNGKHSADFYVQEVVAIQIDTADLIKIDNSMMTEVPVNKNNPMIIEEPMKTEVPVKINNPVIIEESLKTDIPVKIDNPVITEDPVKIDVSVMNLLGKSFNEIKQMLGEPGGEGYSESFGPHNYLLYKHNEGFLQFCSPEAIENKVAVSVILGPGEEVQGVKVGMLFAEIEDILGAPDYGPELGMDDLYYTDYFIGDTFISFSSESINGPTKDAFVKLENYEYGQ